MPSLIDIVIVDVFLSLFFSQKSKNENILHWSPLSDDETFLPIGSSIVVRCLWWRFTVLSAADVLSRSITLSTIGLVRHFDPLFSLSAPFFALVHLHRCNLHSYLRESFSSTYLSKIEFEFVFHIVVVRSNVALGISIVATFETFWTKKSSVIEKYFFSFF